METGERDGRPTRGLTVRRTYPSAIDDVWDAVTTAERIPRWFLPVTGDLRVGGRYQLEGNAGGRSCDLRPAARFAVTWEFGGDVTWVEVCADARTAAPARAASTSRTSTTSAGRSTAPAPSGSAGTSACWGSPLHLASGEPVDPGGRGRGRGPRRARDS